jgi:F-type H+-transporting ATPase subunit epsilon
MDSGQVHLEIVTPDGLKLKTDVSEFTAPSVDGEFGVLPGHVALLAALTTGIVSYVENGEKHLVAVGAGFAEIADDQAVLITDHFITKADVDPVLARLELKEADEALEKFDGDLHGAEHGALVARELWAAAQLELYGDPPPPRLRTMDELSFGAAQDYDSTSTEEEAPTPSQEGDAPH